MVERSIALIAARSIASFSAEPSAVDAFCVGDIAAHEGELERDSGASPTTTALLNASNVTQASP